MDCKSSIKKSCMP